MAEPQVSVDDAGQYLHVCVTGAQRGAAGSHWDQVWVACRGSGQDRFLIEERLPGPRLGTLELFETASAWAQRPWPAGHHIAYVDAAGRLDESARHFVETVARNRGLNVRCFSVLQEAVGWLTGPGDAEQDELSGRA